MKKIVKFIDMLSLLGSTLSGIFIFASASLVTLEIILRFFKRTLYITDEYSGYFMCAISFTALAITLKENEHIRISFLIDFLDKKYKKGLLLHAFCNFVGLFISLFLLKFTFNYFWDSVMTGSRSMSVAATYIAIPKFFMPLGCLLLAFQFVSELLKDILLISSIDSTQGASEC